MTENPRTDIQQAGLGRIAEERDDAPTQSLRCLPTDTELDASSPFRPIWEIWNSRHHPGEPPDWDAFDFVDFKGWHSHLAISSFPPDGSPDPFFRVMGEGWRTIFDGSIANMHFSQMAPRLYELQYHDHFAEIKRTAGIGLMKGQVPYRDRDFLHINVLELPVSRDGLRVGGLLHVLHFED